MSVREEDVIAAYRLILGRYPESEAVIKGHSSARNLHELRNTFLNSDEFRQYYLRHQKANVQDTTLHLPVTAPPCDIDVTCSEQELRLLLERIASTWSDLGKKRPYWSVLTDSDFLPDSIDQNYDRFHETGADDLEIIEAVLARSVPSFDLTAANVTEYGCGVARTTVYLARQCKAVFACDVSEPHLEIARASVAKAALDNVSLYVVSAEELAPAPPCDLWFSRIVLQHNPPPVIAAVLERAFAKLKPGGIALFQVPTYRTGYAFNLRSYLAAAPSKQMEMHVIPQQEVFRIATSCGLTPLDVREDNSVGAPEVFISNLFCFARR